MAYEIHVNAGVSGVEQLGRGEAGIAALDAKTKLLNETLYGASKATEAQTLAQLKYQTQLAKTEEWTLRYKVATLGATQANDQHTQSVTRLGAAHGAAVSQVIATGSALRTLEGAMPIRAAERFLTLIPGIGGALQAAFPVVGAIAFGEVILNRALPAMEKLADKWIPILKAQKDSLEMIKESTKETVKWGEKLEELRFQAIGRREGPGAELRARAESSQSSAGALGDLAAAYRSILSDLETTARQTVGGGLLAPRMPSAKAEAAQALIPGFRARLEEVTAAQEVARETAQGQRADAATADQKATSREDRAQERIDRLAREQALRDDVREWKQIQAEKAKALHMAVVELPRTVDEIVLLNASIQREIAREQKGETAGLIMQSGRERGFLNPDVFGAAQFPTPVGASGDEMMRTAQRRGRRDLGLLNVQAQLGGMSPQEQIDKQYMLRMRLAEEETAALVRKADETRNLQAREDALRDLVEKRYDIALEREQQILELLAKQKEAFERGVVGLIEAARSGRAGSWAMGQLNKIGDEILGKIAGVVFDKISSRTQGGTVSIGDVLGDAQKKATDENTTATDDNTKATEDLTNAIRALRAQAMSPSTGGGSLGGGISAPGEWSGSGPMIFNGFPSANVGGSTVPLYGFPGSGGNGGSGNAPRGGFTIGNATQAAMGAAAVYEGIHSGGARGGLEAAGGAAAAAGSIIAMLSKPLAAAGPIGAAVGIGLSLISSLLGDPKAAREAQIQRRLETTQFMAPVSINAAMTTGGTYSDYDRFGNVRSSDLSPFPTVQQGYFDARHDWTPVPGRTLSQFGGPTGNTTVVHITAMDGADVKRVLDRHIGEVGESLNKGFQTGAIGTGLRETLSAMNA